MNAFFELSRDHDHLLNCFKSENNSCRPHFHSNIEIVYVAKGAMEITINGEIRTITSGCVSAALSHDIHSYHTPEYSESYILIVPVDLVASFNMMTQSKVLSDSFMKSCRRSREIEEAMEKLLEFNEVSDSLIAKGYIYAILGILVEQLGLTERGTESNSSILIRDILVYLENNYLNPLTIDGIARRYGYNKDYLSRLFNSSIGCGFNHYINVLRSRHAALLIRNTDESLDEVAYNSGFQSTRTFSRAFQGFYQMTPLEYKKRKEYRTDADKEVLKVSRTPVENIL